MFASLGVLGGCSSHEPRAHLGDSEQHRGFPSQRGTAGTLKPVCLFLGSTGRLHAECVPSFRCCELFPRGWPLRPFSLE